MTITISNPPYNLKWKRPFFASSQPRFDLGLPPESNANYVFVLSGLANAQSGIYILPNIVLEPTSKDEQAIVKNLVNKNYVEAVVLLPDRMFVSTSIATCILMLNKNKNHSYVEMIDATELADKEIREQRGQFGVQNARVYKKEFNVLSDGTVDDILKMIDNRESREDVCKSVSIIDIKENDYSLRPRKYIDLKQHEAKHRPYEDIANDLNRIIDRKNAFKITINETMAKSLGLQDVAIEAKTGQKLSQNMNEMLKPLNLNLKKEDYLRLSRSKEFKIELKDFENFPEIMSIFLNMYKQMLIVLNNEENRLLVELRDALLPDLLSGRLFNEQTRRPSCQSNTQAPKDTD